MMMKTIILIIGIMMIVAVAAMSIIIPQIMIKNVAKRVSGYKLQNGIPVDQFEVEVIGKRCKSFEEGRIKTIRQADDCELLFRFPDETEQYIMVPYGVYMQVWEDTKGTLYLQKGAYRDFREKYC